MRWSNWKRRRGSSIRSWTRRWGRASRDRLARGAGMGARHGVDALCVRSAVRRGDAPDFVTASGFNWRKPKLADLQPTDIYRNADRQVHLVYAKGTKFVSDLRVVYEIQSRLREDKRNPTNSESTVPQSAPEKQPGRTDGSQPASPRQQNRANDITRQLEVLAEEMPVFAGRLCSR